MHNVITSNCDSKRVLSTETQIEAERALKENDPDLSCWISRFCGTCQADEPVPRPEEESTRLVTFRQLVEIRQF